MSSPSSLEEVWDKSYPASVDNRLWPEEPVPMMRLAQAYFAPGRMILDAPCGDGKNLFALSQIGPTVGCDTSDRGLQICEARRRAVGVWNISLMRGDIFALPFVSASVPSVFCCDLLGHLPNPGDALQEIRRICAPDGVIVATIFSERDSVLQDGRMKALDAHSYWFQNKWFFRFYDESRARRLATENGLIVRHIEEFSWIEAPHPGYREYEHEHVSWCMVLGVGP